MHADRIIEHAQ